MIDYKKFRQITREVGTIFENHKFTNGNGDVIEFLTLYLTLMKNFVEEE